METKKDKMEKENKSNKWKTIAIIFIVLFVAETIYFGYSNYIFNTILENEQICSNEICTQYDTTGFMFDSRSNICHCFNGEKEIHLEKIG